MDGVWKDPRFDMRQWSEKARSKDFEVHEEATNEGGVQSSSSAVDLREAVDHLNSALATLTEKLGTISTQVDQQQQQQQQQQHQQHQQQLRPRANVPSHRRKRQGHKSKLQRLRPKPPRPSSAPAHAPSSPSIRVKRVSHEQDWKPAGARARKLRGKNTVSWASGDAPNPSLPQKAFEAPTYVFDNAIRKPNTEDTDGSAWGIRGVSAPASGPGSRKGRGQGGGEEGRDDEEQDEEDEEGEVDLMAFVGLEEADDEAEAETESDKLQRRVDELEISLLRRDAKSAAESVGLRVVVAVGASERVLFAMRSSLLSSLLLSSLLLSSLLVSSPPF